MSSEHKKPHRSIRLDGENLTLDEVVSVARGVRRVELTSQAKERVRQSREMVERWVKEGRTMYGITTGFGSLQDKIIPPDKVEQLQKNILLSHAAGTGEVVPEEIVRAMIVLRANALAKGYSGIRLEVLERLLEVLNKGVCPLVLEKGSVGSSGDLAPLAHLSLVLIGKGEAFYKGRKLTGAEALKSAGIKQVKLKAKEGLALTNGTQFMTAIGALALSDAERLAKLADIAGAMSLEAMRGRSDAFAVEQVHRLRPFRGQIDCAHNIKALTTGSSLINSQQLMKRRKPTGNAQGADKGALKVKNQDAYSLRCMPQVHGASRQAFAFVRRMLEIEINSANDNPLVMPAEYLADIDSGGRSVSAGNFHGQPVALSMDFLALALSELGNISERRVARLMSEHESFGLPAYLTNDAGLNSGMMIAQYAAAALVSENKVLIHPASGDSIPTSANQEDHNSMGNIAARQAREVLENVERILSIELLCAAQALGLRDGESPGVGTKAALNLIRKRVRQRESDGQGELYKDMEKVLGLVKADELVDAVNRALQSHLPALEPLQDTRDF